MPHQWAVATLEQLARWLPPRDPLRQRWSCCGCAPQAADVCGSASEGQADAYQPLCRCRHTDKSKKQHTHMHNYQSKAMHRRTHLVSAAVNQVHRVHSVSGAPPPSHVAPPPSAVPALAPPLAASSAARAAARKACLEHCGRRREEQGGRGCVRVCQCFAFHLAALLALANQRCSAAACVSARTWLLNSRKVHAPRAGRAALALQMEL